MSAIRITNFSMRPSEVSDIPTLLLLIEWAIHGIVLSPGAQQALIGRSRTMLQSAVREGTSFVAQIEDDIIGFGGWSWDQTLISMPISVGWGGIYMLVVHPRWRRRGVGRQIVKLCELMAQRQSAQGLVIPVLPSTEGFPKAQHYDYVEQFDFTLTDKSVIRMSAFSKTLSSP